jgi:hypothetical protein
MEKKYKTKCHFCGKEFMRKNCDSPKHRSNRSNKQGYVLSGKEFCSKTCFYKSVNKKVTVPCAWCGKEVIKGQSDLRKTKSGKSFCSSSCGASFNNTQRRKSRRSKCEKMLCEMLVLEFPNMSIIANDRDLLDGFEVDISLPEIKLAIEWNGIIHFKAIYGTDKLAKIQNRDDQKIKIAKEKGITLIVVPDLVSTEAYVKEVFQEIKKTIKILT